MFRRRCMYAHHEGLGHKHNGYTARILSMTSSQTKKERVPKREAQSSKLREAKIQKEEEKTQTKRSKKFQTQRRKKLKPKRRKKKKQTQEKHKCMKSRENCSRDPRLRGYFKSH